MLNDKREMSDMLCQSTTGPDTRPTSVHDDDEFIRKFRRIIRLNGLNNDIKASDLLDRTILLELEPIPVTTRRTEREIWNAFNKLRPYALGEMFTIVSMAMSIKKIRQVPSRNLSRLADWRMGECVAIALSMTMNPSTSYMPVPGEAER